MKYKVSELRKELDWSQQKLAQEAEISIAAVSNVERGKRRTSRLVAKVILEALNSAREKQNLPQLTIDDISWELR